MSKTVMAPAPPFNEARWRAQLAHEGLSVERWSNGPGAIYQTHEHPYGKVLVVSSGSITFTVLDGVARLVTLQPGDRLELPPRTPHSAVVGPEGVVCLEAHRPLGEAPAS